MCLGADENVYKELGAATRNGVCDHVLPLIHKLSSRFTLTSMSFIVYV